MKRHLLKIVVFIVLLLALVLEAHAWPARVVHISDGDTVQVEPVNGGDRITIRLQGIDCPELKQPSGMAAKAFLNDALLFREVEVTESGKDRYGRTVAILRTGENTVQEILLRNGLTWVYPRYCKNCNNWKRLQREARKNRVGLWQDENPMPPWEWRNEAANRR